MRARLFVLLVPPTARAMGLGPLMAAGALATAYVYLQSNDRYVDHRILNLRIAALLIALCVAFVLDDPSEQSIASLPTSRLLRGVVRVALALPLAGAWWALALSAAGDVPRLQGGPIPSGDLTLEAATLTVVALVASSFGRLVHDGLGGFVAAPMVLGFVTLVLLAPTEPRLLPSVGDPRWADAHALWKYILLGAAISFLHANRDPARRGLGGRLRRRRTPSREPAPSITR